MVLDYTIVCITKLFRIWLILIPGIAKGKTPLVNSSINCSLIAYLSNHLFLEVPGWPVFSCIQSKILHIFLHLRHQSHMAYCFLVFCTLLCISHFKLCKLLREA
ncbi:uncharacterized protein LOC114576322 [Exaiptasia diaphana]|uniref:Uncharacterized protein n=1 Tax=Exaiptasia diaphana TaxID=2652724 RepID=A0A913YSU6_EXADI|nr:uncharacterized protein LOC114576322 [Exaiptasia diaphana]